MKIGELIDKLQQLNPETELCTETFDGSYRPVFDTDFQLGWMKDNVFYSDFDVDLLEKDTSTMKRVMMV